jgi:hypothetical protein
MRFSAQPVAAAAVSMFAALALVACGGSSGDESDSSAAPAKSQFPSPEGSSSIADFVNEVGPSDQTVVALAGNVFEPQPGESRLGFGLFDVGGTPISDGEVAIYAQAPGSDTVEGPFPASVESLHTDPAFAARTTTEDPDAASVVYVTHLPFEEAGKYRLAAVIKDGDSFTATTTLPGGANVQADSKIPDVGEKAPVVDTPTVDSVGGDIASIDTRLPPDDMHDVNLADALGKKPVVLLFATPQLCQSRVCGPVVDVEDQVESKYKDDVDFIHMEIYEDNKPPKLRPQVTDYGLYTEPWLFVIDKDGNVSTRIEGAFSVPELDDAVKKVLPAGADS